jgi:methylenetetrahydrofolate reductase (NADPH)
VTHLNTKLQQGAFVVTAECGPPQHGDGGFMRKKAAHFRNGVDAVNITDNQTGIVRMSSIAAAKIILEEGLEPVIQMTCRDRNRIAMQSDLLGAAALGIQNVLCLTGDHQKFGNHPEARGVYDLDSVQLISMVHRMNEGAFLSGESIEPAPQFFIGAAANPFAEPFEFRLSRLEKKVRAGARFIQTQAVFDLLRFREWMKGVRESGLHQKTAILAGVLPVRSVKALRYMKEEVSGISIPDSLIERMDKAGDPKEEGVRIAVETIHALRGEKGVRGIHLMPVMWESVTPRILRESGLIHE